MMTDDTPSRPSLEQKVRAVLDEIRPYLKNDGGDIELVSVLETGEVQVRFHGACCGCPHAQMTLSHGVERALREKVAEVTKVVLV